MRVGAFTVSAFINNSTAAVTATTDGVSFLSRCAFVLGLT
jgi:hypothetical protein